MMTSTDMAKLREVLLAAMEDIGLLEVLNEISFACDDMAERHHDQPERSDYFEQASVLIDEAYTNIADLERPVDAEDM